MVDEKTFTISQGTHDYLLPDIFESVDLVSNFCGILHILWSLVQDYVANLEEMFIV